MTAAPLILLDCGECGAPLPGLEADVAFVCPRCGTARELEDGRLVPRPFVQAAAPAEPGARRVNLPVWRFDASVDAQLAAGATWDSLERKRITDRAAELQRVYVLACALPRGDVYGDWGEAWTTLQPEWEPAPERHPVIGASLPSDEARVIGAHYIFDILDAIFDLAGLEVEVDIGEPTLVALPVYHADGRLRPPGGGLEVPGRALDDYEEMVKQATLPDA